MTRCIAGVSLIAIIVGLIPLVAVWLGAGCSKAEPVEGSKAVYRPDIVLPDARTFNDCSVFVVVIDGHEYLYMTGYHRSTLTHKADCKSCAEAKNNDNSR